MIIRSERAELFHADGQTDRQTGRQTDRQTDRQTGMAKLIFLAVLAMHLKTGYEIMGCMYFTTYIKMNRFSESPVALPTSVHCHSLRSTERAGRYTETL
jgi:low temperature requirement protein LtrA